MLFFLIKDPHLLFLSILFRLFCPSHPSHRVSARHSYPIIYFNLDMDLIMFNSSTSVSFT